MKTDPVPEGLRRCRKCGHPKILDAFRVVRSYYNPGGVRLHVCKECERRNNNDWYHKRGGKAKVAARRKGKNGGGKKPPPTPLSRLKQYACNLRFRIKRQQERLREVKREIKRLSGDDV